MGLIDNNHTRWEPLMHRALRLAALADGATSPNPLVGAVVIDSNEKIVGDGFHSFAGMPHAEVEALSQANKDAKGGALVVTLEPCCHQGLTPPCTTAILESGISRVVVAMKDPDPRVSGAGIDFLRNAGIDVITGVLEDQARFLNRAFIFRIKTGRPWGILKWAMSMDGRIGLTNGESKWISGEISRRNVYELRAKTDAVIVGGGTFRRDNPLLTSRGIKYKEPLRVVLSRSLDLPRKSKLWDTSIAETIIAFGPNSDSRKLSEIPQEVEHLKIDPSEPIELLKALAKKGCNQVLWECGPSIASQAIKQDCVQELKVFIAPKLLGGVPAMTPLADLGYKSMNQILEMETFSLERTGKDLVLKMLLSQAEDGLKY